MSVNICSLGNTRLPQHRKLLYISRSINAANISRFPGRQQNAMCNKRARPDICRSVGTAKVGTSEESEIFETNDGVVEAVDDDDAEVTCAATQL